MPKTKTKNGLRRFIATVHEEFTGRYEVEAKDEKEARKIILDGMDGDNFDYCPSQLNSGYNRQIYIDPDFSD